MYHVEYRYFFMIFVLSILIFFYVWVKLVTLRYFKLPLYGRV